MKRQIGTFERLYPNPVVLASCSNGNKDNILTLAWVGTVCSDPPMISISIRPARFSHQIIKDSNEFVLNIPTSSQVGICDYCGAHSGRDGDKFEALGLSREKPSVIKTALIKECPINIECRVRQVIPLGAHDLFIGEVVCVNVDEELIYEDGDIDYDQLDIISHCMGNYFKNEKIG
jgi:flavin reductase (DIM6/NTAB) family NADH-FMN oxidoreductase RutF